MVFTILMLAFAAFPAAAVLLGRVVQEELRVGGEPGVDGGIETLGGHRRAGDGVDLVVGEGAFGALHDLEDLGLVEGGLLADERGLEGRIVLDLGAEAGGFGLMVEVGALDGKAM